MTMRILALAIVLLVSLPAEAQFSRRVRSVTVSQLPATSSVARIYNVRDGSTATDCTVGGGSTAVWCIVDAGGASYTGVSSTASGFAPNADPGVDHPSYVAGHADGANCSAGSYPLGVDAAGAVESCTDASTETDSIVATHTAISGAHHTLFAPTAGVATDHGAESVALTDLADGTDGELITWDATGEAVTVAVGTATHVLTSNGVGAAPTFQAAAGGGLSNVVEDVTPQLGGTLDLNGQDIDGADFDWVGATPALTLGLTDTTTQLILPSLNDSTTPTLAFGDGDTGFFEYSANAIGLSFGGGADRIQFHSDKITGAVTGNPVIEFALGQSSTVPVFTFRNDSNTGVSNTTDDQLSLIAGGVEGLRVTESGGAVTSTVSDTLDVAGEIRITTDDAFASDVAQLYTTAASGLVITGHAGTTNDFLIAESGGATLMRNPAGGSNLIIGEDTGAVVQLGTGSQTIDVQGVFHLTPQASAPATCSIGDFYVDTSGAACACSATNTWSNMHATGSCT